jgi:putative membrane protein
MNHEFYWYWPMWWFPIFMPIFWIIVIAVVLYLIFGRRSARRPWEPGPGPAPESALDILKKRYAKGEITRDEFERMKRDILS